ncbi:MAG TPA: NAD(P)-dependent alcohol dehydrogenase [Acidobacteriota bacterium]|nr:NAD(P)-dependent alcohol dehydrogenase [Acidobacteriota bacterium]
MKTWQIDRFGIDALRLADAALPQPARGEVLVRWRAFSLNYRDLVIVEGSYLPQLPMPFVPLSDGAGEIVAVGDGVTDWQIGDRVVGHYVQSWQSGRATPESLRLALASAALPGVAREFSVLPAHGIVRLPAHLSFEEGATLPIAAVTAWNALFAPRDLLPGATVVLEGTGGVSLFGLQLAHAAGLRTIITSSSDEKLARARSLGADATVNYRTTPEWSRRVREFTDGRGADLALEVGGPATFAEAARSVRLGGRIAIIGFLSGHTLPVDALSLIGNLTTVHGLRVGSRADFIALNCALEHHAIHPTIDRVFPFEELPEAFARLSRGEHFGKIVIRGVP